MEFIKVGGRMFSMARKSSTFCQQVFQ